MNIVYKIFGGKAHKGLDEIRKILHAVAEKQEFSKKVDLSLCSPMVLPLATDVNNALSSFEQVYKKQIEFISCAAHELKTPVAVLKSNSFNARSYTTIDQYKENFALIEEYSERLNILVKSLLFISRANKGTLRAEFKVVDISTLVHETFIGFEPYVSDMNISMSFDIQPDLFVMCEPGQVSQIFINFVQNSFSYGKPDGYVKVSLKEKDDKIVFSVEDDGIGIARKNLEHIWEPFWQADASRNNDGSSGLGLAIVKLFADMNKAELDVESALGEGSTFSISFNSYKGKA